MNTQSLKKSIDTPGEWCVVSYQAYLPKARRPRPKNPNFGELFTQYLDDLYPPTETLCRIEKRPPADKLPYFDWVGMGEPRSTGSFRGPNPRIPGTPWVGSGQPFKELLK